MNIVKISGGLGSQMFQYAFFSALNENTDSKGVDMTDNLLKATFGINAKSISHKERVDMVDISNSFWAKFRRNTLKMPRATSGTLYKESSFSYDKNVFKRTDCYYDGCWKSWKYFDGIESEIRKLFTFNLPLSSMNHACVEAMRQCESVSIHIRRGNNVKKNRIKEIGSVCSSDYYNWAIAHIKEQLGDNVHYFIFSDDIAWARANLPLKNASYIDWNKGKESYNDMRLMAACKHNIIANSSFSWWGAYLNTNPDKIVLAPAKWYRTIPVPDIIPQGWVQLPVD